ncbi:MAG: hypothetical protein EPN99_07835 [Frankiales bacterium]|nr:MAG: hypothetical protein EPN99_07835 [Frankiales bacterium]
MADDDVQLTDLEVIQRYSLAVRGASAARSEVIAALQADLDWLRGSRRAAPAKTPATSPAKASGKAPAKSPAKAAKSAPAKRTAAKG